MIYWSPQVLTINQYLHIRYELVAVNESETAKYGYVQAGLNQIINKVTNINSFANREKKIRLRYILLPHLKEVDISTLCIVPTPERALYMDFSYPVAIESYKLLVPKPGKESRLFGPIRPFENMVTSFIHETNIFLFM